MTPRTQKTQSDAVTQSEAVTEAVDAVQEAIKHSGSVDALLSGLIARFPDAAVRTAFTRYDGYRFVDGSTMLVEDADCVALVWFGRYGQTINRKTGVTYDCYRKSEDMNGLSVHIPTKEHKPQKTEALGDIIRHCGIRMLSDVKADTALLSIDSTKKTTGTVKAAEHTAVITKSEAYRNKLRELGLSDADIDALGK